MKELICKVRDDEDISLAMDIIDWNEGFYYDGKMNINRNKYRPGLDNISDDDLFRKIDKTLAHFSYICYLRKKGILEEDDFIVFEYALRRIANNPEIKKYLRFLYNWSDKQGVHCSFDYLIQYFLEKQYYSKDFEETSSQ